MKVPINYRGLLFKLTAIAQFGIVSLLCSAAVQSMPSSQASPATRDSEPRASYIRPSGAGDHSGSDWDNAASLSEIDQMIQRAGSGGTIYLLADAGPYLVTDRIGIGHGGSAAHPVKIMGSTRSGARAKALITGTRTRPCPATQEAFAQMQHGTPVFTLMAGADQL